MTDRSSRSMVSTATSPIASKSTERYATEWRPTILKPGVRTSLFLQTAKAANVDTIVLSACPDLLLVHGLWADGKKQFATKNPVPGRMFHRGAHGVELGMELKKDGILEIEVENTAPEDAIFTGWAEWTRAPEKLVATMGFGPSEVLPGQSVEFAVKPIRGFQPSALVLDDTEGQWMLRLTTASDTFEVPGRVLGVHDLFCPKFDLGWMKPVGESETVTVTFRNVGTSPRHGFAALVGAEIPA